MKKNLIIFFLLFIVSSLKSENWEVNISGYFDNKKMFLSDKTMLLHYTNKATWNNTLGDFGKSKCYGTVLNDESGRRKEDLVICEYEDTIGEVYWMKPKRSGSEMKAGVGISVVIAATKKYESFIGAQCVYAISYYDKFFHGKQKCKKIKKKDSLKFEN